MEMVTFLIIAIINGVVWFTLGYKLGKDFGQYTNIDHQETELLEDENGKWFLRYTPYGPSASIGNNNAISELMSKKHLISKTNT